MAPRQNNVDQIITQQYDFVCNGHEVGVAIRAHQADVASYLEIRLQERADRRAIWAHAEAFLTALPMVVVPTALNA